MRFGASLPLRARFVPPWKRAGCEADELFGGVLQSANPLSRRRRDEERHAELEEEVEVAAQLSVASRQQTEEIAKAVQTEALTAAASAERFLPLGAVRAASEHWGLVAASHTGCDSTQLPDTCPTWLRSRCGFAVDMDGVLRSWAAGAPGPVRGAAHSLRWLTNSGVPFVLFTNVCGASHADMATRVNHTLAPHGAPLVTADQIVMSSDPMRHLASALPTTTATLVVGNGSTREELEKIGFPHPMLVSDVVDAFPELAPLRDSERRGVTPASISHLPAFSSVVVASTLHCDALTEIQLIVDVLTSPFGRITGAVASDQSVPLLVAADDMYFPASPGITPRLGPGCYREMLCSVYESVAGRPPVVTPYGKPRRVAFVEARRRLKELAAAHGGSNSLEAIFMVGDNIESDIIGANAAGRPWHSVHVSTGVRGASSAVRTLCEGDAEAAWSQAYASREPTWRADSLVQFLDELCVVPDFDQVLARLKPRYPPPFPVSLDEAYRLPHGSW